MEYYSFTPEMPLASFVESITFFDGYQPAHDREVLIPDGSVNLIVDPSDKGKRLYRSPFASDFVEYREAWISGLQQRPITIEAQQGASLLVVKFVPGGAGPVLGCRPQALTDRVAPLLSVIGAAATELRSLIISADDVEARTAAAHDWLLRRVGPKTFFDPVLAAMLGLLTENPGIAIAKMANCAGFGERHARNLFRAGVGVNPKQFARILRFQALLKHLAASGGDAANDLWLAKGRISVPDWADMAQAFGYADQSHMNIDFRALSGFTPSGYVAAYRGMENFLPVTLAKS